MARIIRGDFPNGERGVGRSVRRGGELGLEPSAVACLNLTPRPGDVSGNLLMAGREVRAALRREPSLRWVVLPELVTCGYSDLESVHRFAEDADTGESARFFAGLARELGIYIAYGFPEVVAGTAAGVYDSANLVGPEGVLATYRKRNLVGTTPEHYVFRAGMDLPVVEAGGMLVALVICWDLGFPETAREAAMGGADLILAPAAWREPWGPQYGLSCAARALDSGVYVASANQLGLYPEARFGTPGHLYGPDGLRVSRSLDRMSLGVMDPAAPELWRALYGGTLMENEKVASIDEEPVEICS